MTASKPSIPYHVSPNMHAPQTPRLSAVSPSSSVAASPKHQEEKEPTKKRKSKKKNENEDKRKKVTLEEVLTIDWEAWSKSDPESFNKAMLALTNVKYPKLPRKAAPAGSDCQMPTVDGKICTKGQYKEQKEKHAHIGRRFCKSHLDRIVGLMAEKNLSEDDAFSQISQDCINAKNKQKQKNSSSMKLTCYHISKNKIDKTTKNKVIGLCSRHPTGNDVNNLDHYYCQSHLPSILVEPAQFNNVLERNRGQHDRIRAFSQIQQELLQEEHNKKAMTEREKEVRDALRKQKEAQKAQEKVDSHASNGASSSSSPSFNNQRQNQQYHSSPSYSNSRGGSPSMMSTQPTQRQGYSSPSLNIPEPQSYHPQTTSQEDDDDGVLLNNLQNSMSQRGGVRQSNSRGGAPGAYPTRRSTRSHS